MARVIEGSQFAALTARSPIWRYSIL